MRTRFPAAALAVLACITTPVMAQSAQRWSLQASGLYVGVGGDAYEGLKSGPGGEVQVRLTPGLWSYGAGAQYSSHGIENGNFTVSLSGVFFEPRRVFDVGSAKYAPYLSGRIAYLSLSADLGDIAQASVRSTSPELSLAVARRATTTISASGLQGNVGGGVLVKMSPRVNLDLGATIGGIRFGKATLEVDGRAIDTSDGVTGTGQNVVVRAGLAIGLGSGTKKAAARPAPRR